MWTRASHVSQCIMGEAKTTQEERKGLQKARRKKIARRGRRSEREGAGDIQNDDRETTESFLLRPIHRRVTLIVRTAQEKIGGTYPEMIKL